MIRRSILPLLLLLTLASLACGFGGTSPADRLESAAATAGSAAATVEGVAGTAAAIAGPTLEAVSATAAAAVPTLQVTIEALITAAPTVGANAQDALATLAAQGVTTIEALNERLAAVTLDANGEFRLTIGEAEWNEALRARQFARTAGGDPPAMQEITFNFTPAGIQLAATVVRPLPGVFSAQVRPYVDGAGAVQIDVEAASFNDVAVPQAILLLAAGTVTETINDVIAGLPGDLVLTAVELSDDGMTLVGRRR